MAERRIGIDFGTSTTVIRVRRYEDGKALGDLNAVKIDGEDTIPTLIAELLNGNGCYFGKRAENMRHQSRQNKVILHSNFKLKLESPDQAEREAAKRLTAAFLKHLGDAYTHQSSFLGSPDDEEKTYISYPVKWSEETRAFMVKAAKDAGFPNVEGLDEAQACIRAVTEYCAKNLEKSGVFRSGAPCTILLIDMGAGTTDLVLCRYTPGTGETVTLSTWPKDGEMLFGGCEVDELLAAYIRGSFPETASVQKLPGGKFKAWKDELVSPTLAKGETVDHFDALETIADTLADVGVSFDPSFDPINRTKFEEITAAYLSGFPKLVNEALADAGLKGEAVDLVILTGGHSQWYFAREMLLGRMPQFGEIRLEKIQADPARIVSLGLPQETVAQGLVVYHVSAEEMYNCGENYYYGRGVEQDYSEAVKCYRKAAEQGYAAALYSLGYCYYNGQGVKQDYAEAVSWYSKAAEQGHAGAQYNLGGCYYNGQGVEQDYAEAVSWFRKAAEQGHSLVQFSLGYCYYNGRGVEQDYAEAVSWFRKAAEQGDADAQYNLGVCYYNGQGVEQDYAEAVSWFRKAAEQGYADAYIGLGLICYQDGDYHNAQGYFRNASNEGSAEGAYLIASCYSEGKGVPINQDRAQEYFKLAAERGYKDIASVELKRRAKFLSGKLKYNVKIGNDVYIVGNGDYKKLFVKTGQYPLDITMKDVFGSVYRVFGDMKVSVGLDAGDKLILDLTENEYSFTLNGEDLFDLED